MINNRIIQLIKRVERLGLKNSLNKEEIEAVEKVLNLTLPDDFKVLCSYCSYEFLYSFEFITFCADENDGVITETLGWRDSINLPHNYLVLADDGTSAILMKIEEDDAEVIWCSLEDVLNICAGKSMEYNPTVFPSFIDFYEFLLDEEEKERVEENALNE